MTTSQNETQEEDYSLGNQVKDSWIADHPEPKGNPAEVLNIGNYSTCNFLLT